MIPGWKDEILATYLEILREQPHARPTDVAARLGVTEDCAIYWLTDLARQGRIRIGSVDLVDGGPDRAVPGSGSQDEG
jgi:Mn-dependent DtxR family transcriptional regulator